MIEVITPDMHRSHQAELEAMFRLRYRVFKQRLNWDVPCQDGMEIDQYDHGETSYLLLRDDAGNIAGTCRLIPTTSRYMLAEDFKGFLNGEPPPHDPSVWEGSRLAVEARLGDTDNTVNPLTRQLYCGLVEFGLAVGMREIMTVYDIRVARFLTRVGCRPKWRSKSQRLCGIPTMAVRFDIDQDALDKLRAAGGITEPVIGTAPWLKTRRAA